MKRTKAKTERTKVKKPETRTLKVQWVIDPVIQVPTSTSIKECPRCGKTHLKLKVKKLKRPIKVADRQADNWAPCPKTGEPIIFFTFFIRPSMVEETVMKGLADQIASEVDKEVLADLFSFVEGFQKKQPPKAAVTATTATSEEQPPQQLITLGYAGKESETWIHTDSEPKVSLASGPPLKKGKKAAKKKR